jgi:hypothetical protein
LQLFGICGVSTEIIRRNDASAENGTTDGSNLQLYELRNTRFYRINFFPILYYIRVASVQYALEYLLCGCVVYVCT